MGFTDLQDLQSAHKRWIEASLQVNESERQSHWTESIASGSKVFIEEVKESLGFKVSATSLATSSPLLPILCVIVIRDMRNIPPVYKFRLFSRGTAFRLGFPAADPEYLCEYDCQYGREGQR
jgi:hypothetical protein